MRLSLLASRFGEGCCPCIQAGAGRPCRSGWRPRAGSAEGHSRQSRPGRVPIAHANVWTTRAVSVARHRRPSGRPCEETVRGRAGRAHGVPWLGCCFHRCWFRQLSRFPDAHLARLRHQEHAEQAIGRRSQASPREAPEVSEGMLRHRHQFGSCRRQYAERARQFGRQYAERTRQFGRQ
jgi:hypothetical protein